MAATCPAIMLEMRPRPRFEVVGVRRRVLEMGGSVLERSEPHDGDSHPALIGAGVALGLFDHIQTLIDRRRGPGRDPIDTAGVVRGPLEEPHSMARTRVRPQ